VRRARHHRRLNGSRRPRCYQAALSTKRERGRSNPDIALRVTVEDIERHFKTGQAIAASPTLLMGCGEPNHLSWGTELSLYGFNEY
jgi:hypothetical protein